MKYIVETDSNEDIDAMNMLINKNKVGCAFYDLQGLLHRLINRKFYDDVDYIYDEKTDKDFISVDWMEDRIRDIYKKFSFMTDYE